MRSALLIAFWVAVQVVAAQNFTFGAASDPCAGGFPLAIARSGATVRYGADFTCTLTVPGPGIYTVDASFLEPCYAPLACAAGQVRAGGRLQNVYVNGRVALAAFDPWLAGATDSVPAVHREIAEADAQNHITVRVLALPCFRSSCTAVLAGVSIAPLPMAVSTQGGVTGQPCIVPLGQAPTLMARLPDGSCLPIIGVADANTAASTSRITADIGTAAGIPSQGKIHQLQVSPK